MTYTEPDTLELSNENGDLTCKPISWKETQTCQPAIRPVPLAQSEYLDDKTFVITPRKIECILRLSDREKDIFEAIYNYASTNGSDQYTDIFLTYDSGESDEYDWYFQVWLTEKDYKWDYSMEYDRAVRWWYVTVTMDVKEFYGSNDTLPSYPLSTVQIANQTLDFVTGFERDDTHPPFLPKWVNQDAAVESYIWNECVLDLTYTCRMTNQERYYMDELFQDHQKYQFSDYIHNLFSIAGNDNGVWISEIEVQWDDKNWVKPWLVTIHLQANNSEIESRTSNLTLDSLAYPNASVVANHLGTLYLDEMPNPQGLPSEQSIDVGVHILYFFPPTVSTGFHDWDLWGGSGVIVLEEQDFDGESILTILVTGNCIIMPRYNVPIATQCVVTLTDGYWSANCCCGSGWDETDFGTMTIDGIGYPLPNSPTINDGSHTLAYSTNNAEWSFGYWLSSSNITIANPTSSGTTFTITDSTPLGIGFITAVLTQVDYQVALSTNIDNPCTPETITLGGIGYSTPTTFREYYGDYSVVISGYPNPASEYGQTYEFDHWIVSGGVTVDDINDVVTTIHIHDDGTLEAFYVPIEITFDTRNASSSSQHIGMIDWYVPSMWFPVIYSGSLPSTQNWGRNSGIPINFKYVVAGGKTFNHWESTGGVFVDGGHTSSNAITAVTITGSGTLTAVYTP